MSTKSDFIKQPNVQLLWEILSEQLVLDTKPERIRKDIYNVLTQNIRGFYTSENERIGSLVGLNKKFISVLVQYINSKYTNTTYSNTPTDKINNFEQLALTKKINNFEQELKQKQSEFNQLMTLPVPPVPNFKDDASDSPMTEMELAIKKASEMRNYDLEAINATRQPPPQMTSSKQGPPQIRINENLDSRVLNRDIIDLMNTSTSTKAKHITWAFEENSIIKEDKKQENNEEPSDEINALFQKLKKVPTIITPPVEETDRIQVLETKIDLILQLLKDYRSVFTSESTSSSL